MVTFVPEGEGEKAVFRLEDIEIEIEKRKHKGDKNWEVWFVKSDIYGNPLIHTKIECLSWEELHDVQELLKNRKDFLSKNCC